MISAPTTNIEAKRKTFPSNFDEERRFYMTVKKRLICFLTLLIFVLSQCIMPVFAETQKRVYTTGKGAERWIDTLEFPDRDTSVAEDISDEDIAVEYNGRGMEFMKKPFIKDGEIMVPAKEFVEKLGFFLEKSESLPVPGRFAGLFGEVNGADMSVYADSDKAYYDDVPLELPTNTVGDGDDIFVPLYFIQFIYGINIDINGGNVKVRLEVEAVEEVEEETEKPNMSEVLAGVEGTPMVTWEKMLEQGPSGTPGKDTVVNKIVDLENDKFDKVIEIENNQKAAVFYDNQVYWPNESRVTAGDILVLTGWVRNTYAIDESGFAKTQFCIESNGDWTKALMSPEIEVGTEWQYFEYACSSPFSREVGGTGLKIRVGYNLQHTQYANVNVVNYGKSVKLKDLTGVSDEKVVEVDYRGQEDDALWREEALRRIEKYRKSPIKAVVVDEDGNPVKDADVRFNMIKNEFMFGTEISSGIYGGSRYDAYWNLATKYFNSFVMGNHTKPGHGGYEAAAVMNETRTRNLTPKWHVILYDSFNYFSGYDCKNMSYDEAYEMWMKNIADRCATYGDYMQEVELANELLDYKDFYSLFGWDFYVDILEGANEFLGDNRIKMINSTGVAGQDGGIDYQKSVTVKSVFDKLAESGVEFNSVGMQAHATSGSSNPVDMYLQIDDAAFDVDYTGCTEYDYTASALGETSDAALHKKACHLRDTILTWYSHPKATSFVMWSFLDYWHWRNVGPLADYNITPKEEADKYWTELVMDEWKPDISGKTDENGIFEDRTHRGDFDVTVTVGGKSATCRLKTTEDGENTVWAVVKNDGSIELESSATYMTEEEKRPKLDSKNLTVNRKNQEDLYNSLSENKAVSAVNKDGRDAEYLLDAENETTWVSASGDDYLTLELGETRRKGYVTLKWADGEKYGYTVEVSEDGENWEKIAGSESSDERDVVKFFYSEKEPKAIKYIRIGSADGNPISLKGAAVYPVKYFAERK